MPGELTSELAAVACRAFVTVAEPVTVPLLRRAAIDATAPQSSHGVPAPRGGGAAMSVGLARAARPIHGPVRSPRLLGRFTHAMAEVT